MLGGIFRYGNFANIYGKNFDLHPSKCMYIGTPSVDALKVTVSSKDIGTKSKEKIRYKQWFLLTLYGLFPKNKNTIAFSPYLGGSGGPHGVKRGSGGW